MCESAKLSAISKKSERIASILGRQRAYRLNSGTPNVRMSYYLQHLGEKEGKNANFPLFETIDFGFVRGVGGVGGAESRPAGQPRTLSR